MSSGLSNTGLVSPKNVFMVLLLIFFLWFSTTFFYGFLDFVNPPQDHPPDLKFHDFEDLQLLTRIWLILLSKSLKMTPDVPGLLLRPPGHHGVFVAFSERCFYGFIC